jgi:hypothetical protein
MSRNIQSAVVLALGLLSAALLHAQASDPSSDWDDSASWSTTARPGIPLPQGFTGTVYSQKGANRTGLQMVYGLLPPFDRPQQLQGLVALMETAFWTGPSPITRMKFLMLGRQKDDNVSSGAEPFWFSSSTWAPYLLALPLAVDMTHLSITLQVRQSDGKIAVQTPRVTLEDNRLQDPSADEPPVTKHGWVAMEGDWDKPRNVVKEIYDPWHLGASVFWAGQSPRGVLAQTVSLAPFAEWRRRSNPRAVFTGFVGSYGGDKDSSGAAVEALDAEGSVLDSRVLPQTDADLWMPFALDLPIPDSAVSIRVRLTAVRVAGKDNNGYFDNLALMFPGSGPADRQQMVLRDYSAPKGPSQDETRLSDAKKAFIEGKQLPVITPVNGAWADSPEFSDSIPQLDGKRTIAYQFDSTRDETLTVNLDKVPPFLVIVEVTDADFHVVSRATDEYEQHVVADLVPGHYTVFITVTSPEVSGQAAMTVATAARTRVTLGTGPVRQSFLANPVLMEQMTSLDPGPQWMVHHEFLSIGPKIDGLPARVFMQPVKKGETAKLKVDPPEITMEVYDEKYNRLDEPGAAPGDRIVRVKASGKLYILVLGPKAKYFRDFFISREAK